MSFEYRFTDTFNSISTVGDSSRAVFSKTHFFKDMPWYISAHTIDKGLNLGIFLNCNDDDRKSQWRCQHKTAFKIRNHNDDEKSLTFQFHNTFTTSHLCWGVKASKERLLDKNEGFIKEDRRRVYQRA
ncbi:hypothetical protein PMAYCL1PPCAC_01385 [Pristionchus mayeri]|uniref:MATH domain-containing protein n=1 Tax=Pristionchus mayeri TaxID=1317129 RepID=A0AAN5C5A3_9BILA|nr:hypothetical protein PMAYCL1PPCAC_01385 [Pristionchus mayeri]